MKVIASRTVRGAAGWYMSARWVHGEPDHPHDSGLLRAWYVEAPFAHPEVQQYMIVVMHLRDQESPPKLDESVTHQVTVMALDTLVRVPFRAIGYGDPTAVVDLSGVTPLLPFNFEGQFAAKDDYEAIRRVQDCVEEIIAGTMQPTEHFRWQWRQRFPYERTANADNNDDSARQTLAALCEWRMVSDPMPVSPQATAWIDRFLEFIANDEGFDNWIDAYHGLPRVERAP